MVEAYRASTELWAMAGLATPMALRVAATLRVADRIAEKPLSASELAEAVGADAGALDRVLRHLVTLGAMICDEYGRYALTDRGEALRDGHPSALRARLDIEGAVGRADLSLVQLLHSVRTGEPAYPAQFGRSFWADLSSDASLSASFDALMGCDVGAEAPAIVRAYDWGSLRQVVDVGGGDGTLMIALLTEHRELRGTVVDLPHAAAAAGRALTAAGLDDRAEAVAGSFFDPLPPGRGGYLLSAIIHNWDDDAAGAILRRCAEAAGDSGSVFVIERIGADGRSVSSERDLRSLAYFAGRQRNLGELVALAARAGLQVAAAHPADVNVVLELVAVLAPRARPEPDS